MHSPKRGDLVPLWRPRGSGSPGRQRVSRVRPGAQPIELASTLLVQARSSLEHERGAVRREGLRGWFVEERLSAENDTQTRPSCWNCEN
jgi:hypothetical protein